MLAVTCMGLGAQLGVLAQREHVGWVRVRLGCAQPVWGGGSSLGRVGIVKEEPSWEWRPWAAGTTAPTRLCGIVYSSKYCHFLAGIF